MKLPNVSAEWLAEVLDAMEEIVFVKGRSSQILWANRAFRDNYNMSEEDLKEFIDASHVDPKDTANYLSADKQVFETGKRYETVEPITRHDGTALQYRTVKTGIQDSEGNIERLVGVARHIGDTTLDEEESEAFHRTHARELQQFLDSLPVGVLAVDNTGKISVINEEAGRILDISTDDERQKAFDQIERKRTDGTELPLEQLPIYRALNNDEWVNGETIQIRKKNSAKDTWLNVSSRPLTTSSKHRAVSAIADVTERVEREHILELSLIHI